MISALLHDLADGASDGELCPDPDRLREAVRAIMRGEVLPAQIAALLMGLRCRGERAEHLKAVVETMLENATPFPGGGAVVGPLADTCGTGGDMHGTVNISTAAAFVAAAAGVPIAKHGNRSVSSRSGSADVLEALGFRIDCAPERSAEMLAEHRFCFLFAPLYHPAMKHAGPVRRELRVRTIFNLAGPLSNPAGITHQLVGVPRHDLIEPVANALRLLGRRGALVVHGRNGEDEISLTTATEGMLLTADGRLHPWFLDPTSLGLRTVEMADLVAEDAEDSAAKIRRALGGEEGPVATIIALNAAAVLLLADAAPDMATALLLAQDTCRSGAALALIERAAEASRR